MANEFTYRADHIGGLIPPAALSDARQRYGRGEIDLDRLRETYLPALSETVETPGGDYRYRAWIGRDDLAEGMAGIARSANYPNVKDEVARRDASRAHVYGEVWSVLGELQPGGPYSG